MAQSSISKGVGEVGSSILIIVLFALVIGSIIGGVALFANIDVTGTVTNETISAADNVTNSTLAIKSTYSNAICSLTTVNNATDGVVLDAGNYTFYANDCNLILADDSEYIGEDVNATYGYTYESNNTLSGVNINGLSAVFAAFIVAITSFIVIGGTLLGILWILPYIRPLFKKDALGTS